MSNTKTRITHLPSEVVRRRNCVNLERVTSNPPPASVYGGSSVSGIRAISNNNGTNRSVSTRAAGSSSDKSANLRSHSSHKSLRSHQPPAAAASATASASSSYRTRRAKTVAASATVTVSSSKTGLGVNGVYIGTGRQITPASSAFSLPSVPSATSNSVFATPGVRSASKNSGSKAGVSSHPRLPNYPSSSRYSLRPKMTKAHLGGRDKGEDHQQREGGIPTEMEADDEQIQIREEDEDIFVIEIDESVDRDSEQIEIISMEANESIGDLTAMTIVDAPQERSIPAAGSSFLDSIIAMGAGGSADRSRQSQVRNANSLIPPVLRNFDPGNCEFCSVELATGDGIMISDCLHTFCRDCLQATVELQKDLIKIPCPLTCGAMLSDAEVKELLSPVAFQEYIDRSLVIARKKMKNIFTCKTESCLGWCEYEEGRRTFICPMCNKNNCVECGAIHTGVSCEDYKSLTANGEFDKLQELINKESNNGWDQLQQNLEASGEMGTSQFMEEIAKSGIIHSSHTFECPICICDIEPGEGVILQECLHLFCKTCLIGLVEHNDDAIVKCPYISGNYSCVCTLQPREIKALVPPEILEKHLMRSVKLGESNIENSFHCKTPDCPGWCVYDQGVKRFRCPNCGKSNCIPCMAIHKGSCEDYKNSIQQNINDKLSEAALQKLIDKGEYMRCPKCKIPVQKTKGCDWVMCSACRTEICWATRGPRWGPRGYGDTSGGCKCRLNGGKLCHPKCKNCH